MESKSNPFTRSFPNLVGQEAEETLKAIVLGQIDALLIDGTDGPRVYTLNGAADPYRHLIERMSEAAIVLDENGLVLYGNGRLNEWLGLGSTELTGQEFQELVTPAHQARLAGLIAAASRFPAAVEIDLMRRGGGNRPVRLSATRIEFDERPCLALVATDLSTVQRSDRVAAANAFAGAILEQATQALIVCDLNGVITHANQAATSLCTQFPVGRNFGEAIAIEPPGLDQQALANKLSDGIEASLQLPDRLCSFLASGAPLYDASGAVVGCVIALSDITAQKTAQLNAERANRAKTRFLAAASHDLRQPTQALFLLSGLLAHKNRDAELAPIIAKIERSMAAQQEMLDGLLRISQLDAGIVDIKKTDFAIGPLLERVVDELAISAREKGLVIRLVRSRAVINSDPLQLERILRNLIDNAIKYTERGRILVGCRAAGGRLRLQIWDTGAGIASHQVTKIFEEFVQLDNPDRNRTKGLGLGLSIVDRLARMLDHPVAVRSAEGRGTGFEITVPLVRRLAGSKAAKTARSPSLRRRGVVAVIDDDHALLDAMRLSLEAVGYTVLAGTDTGQVVIGIHRARSIPDAVIADYHLAHGQGGIEAIGALRSKFGRPMAGILLTGDTAIERAKEARKGACELLHKPVKIEEVVKVLDRQLRDKYNTYLVN